MPVYTNIHTHIFNLKCVPNRFYGFSIVQFLNIKFISVALVKGLKFIIPGRKDFLNRYANMLKIGSKKNQELIFKNLQSSYKHLRVKFVILTLDMDKMEAGKIINNYETQITQLINIKRKFMNDVLPFLSVDPRKKYNGSLYKYLKNKFDNWGFIGIKLYPALGFYPFDPQLADLYKFAQKNKVPIIVHCDKGGIYYQGEITRKHTNPPNLNPNTNFRIEYPVIRKKMRQKELKIFKNNFTNPKNYEDVLAVYPKLKICFAHYGGAEEILNSIKNNSNTPETNWYLKIRDMIKKNKNIYADVSYTLTDNDALEIINKDIEDNNYGNQLLFGSDFYMTIRKKNEVKLFKDFLNQISSTGFDRIAVANPNSFLKSKYYQP